VRRWSGLGFSEEMMDGDVVRTLVRLEGCAVALAREFVLMRPDVMLLDEAEARPPRSGKPDLARAIPARLRGPRY